MNFVENIELPQFDKIGKACVMDLPGIGFFKSNIIDTLPNSILIITFLDSTDKQSISQAGEYLYDILNNENFDDSVPIIISCSKQDQKFPKSKKLVESDLANEIENIKNIKQKNNLEDSSQLGPLFSMRAKFNFSTFKDIHFVETDKTNGFESVIEVMKKVL